MSIIRANIIKCVSIASFDHFHLCGRPSAADYVRIKWSITRLWLFPIVSLDKIDQLHKQTSIQHPKFYANRYQHTNRIILNGNGFQHRIGMVFHNKKGMVYIEWQCFFFLSPDNPTCGSINKQHKLHYTDKKRITRPKCFNLNSSMLQFIQDGIDLNIQTKPFFTHHNSRLKEKQRP